MSSPDPKLTIAGNLGISRILFAAGDDTQRLLEALRQQKHVEAAQLDDGGVKISITPDPRDITKMIVLSILPVITLGGMAIAIDRNWIDVDLPINPLKLYIFAGIGAMAGLIMILVRLTSGPPKPSTIELHPGRIKFDFYVAGDHIVKEYRADDVVRIDNTLGLDFHLKTTTLTPIPFASSETVNLVYQLVNLILWRK